MGNYFSNEEPTITPMIVVMTDPRNDMDIDISDGISLQNKEG